MTRSQLRMDDGQDVHSSGRDWHPDMHEPLKDEGLSRSAGGQEPSKAKIKPDLEEMNATKLKDSQGKTEAVTVVVICSCGL
jgi:hypothetical protein